MNEDLPTKFPRRIASFGDVHCAVNYDFANLSMVRVAGGYVAIDAGSHPSISCEVVANWKQIAAGPLLAMIYTHSHTDHIGGADAFAMDDVPVWSHERFMDELTEPMLLPNAYFARSAKQFGSCLEKREVDSNGIGRPLRLDIGAVPRIRIPNHTFREQTELAFGGTTFVLRSGPGETTDHLFAWLPDQRVLFAGDNLYKAFPNLYSIRGVPPRPIRGWIDTLDQMRRLQPRPEVMILGHTEPVVGSQNIHDLLTLYRDAIAFVHDSVVRGINAGRTPDQLAREIRLPESLAEHPYLQEQYGTVAGSIRGIYGGYIGWFDGDAANLDPVADDDIAGWIVGELGGRGEVKSRIELATQNGDLKQAVWLCRMLQVDSPNWHDGKLAKAQVLEIMAANAKNPLSRSWLASEAALLRNRRSFPAKPKIDGGTVCELPVEQMLRLLPSRLNPKTSATLTTAIGFDLTDTRQGFTLFIRNGVGELAPGLNAEASLVIRASEPDMKRIFLIREVTPIRSEFWKRLHFDVPEAGVLTPFRKLLRLARMRRLFLLV